MTPTERPLPGSARASWLPSRGLVIAVFLPIYLFVQSLAGDSRSVTYDEPVHLAAGYAALRQQDFRFDPTHPPLARIWAALPILLIPGLPPVTYNPTRSPLPLWLGEDSFQAGAEFLRAIPNPLRAVQQARTMILLFGAAIGIILFLWAWEVFGRWPAVCALVLFALEPNLSAHATLITTDVPVTALFLATVYFFWRMLVRPGPGYLLATAGCFALACVTKYSAVILLPILVGTWLAAGGARRFGLRSLVVCLLTCGYFAWVVIWATYAFRQAPSPGTGFTPEAIAPFAAQAPVLAAVLRWIDAWHLLPSAYSQGFLLCQTTAQDVEAYLNGATQVGGWWYYFPLAFLLKTPVLLVLAAGLGLVLLLRRPTDEGPPILPFLVVPIVVYLGFAMTSRINLGVRHLLPVYPFVLMGSGATFAWLLQPRIRHGRAVVAAGLAVSLVLTARAWPHHLSYFSLVVGGSTQGTRYLSDSNVDWGQGLKDLRAWTQENGVGKINLAYFGTADPGIYGINATYLPGSPFYLKIEGPSLPGYVVVSTTIQSGVGIPLVWDLFYGGFSQLTPVAKVANSLRVYWVNHWPESPLLQKPNPSPEEMEAVLDLANEMQFRLTLAKDSLPYYDFYLQRRPTDSSVRLAFGQAQLHAGLLTAALTSFRQAIVDAERPAYAGTLAAMALLAAGLAEPASDFAQAAVVNDPNDAFAHNALGLAYTASDRLVVAESSFVRAVELDPEFTRAAENLAHVRHLLGKETMALPPPVVSVSADIVP
jgi:4-amino-4-deoxy-L-arabinose transferase-like glycosyltransferase